MKWSTELRQRFPLDRRSFSKMSLGALGGWWLARNCSGQEQGNQPENSSFNRSDGELPANAGQTDHIIRYVRDSAPEFHIPPYRGVRYEDTVPDTLDIAERAKLGVHVLTAITDPHACYEIYWAASFALNPPVMTHDFNDWVQNCEGFMEALPLLRLATGSSLNDQVDPVWMKGILRSIGPDGLVYFPFKECPWTRIDPVIQFLNPVWSSSGKKLTIADSSVEQVATPVTCQRIISTMTVYYLRDGNPMWKDTIEKMIQRLAALAIVQGDYAYMPGGSIEPNGNYGPGPMPLGRMADDTNARLIQGLAQYYKVTGYEPARDLAGKLTRYMRLHAQYYEPDGTPLVGSDEKSDIWFQQYGIEQVRHGGHGHSHGIGLLSVLEYAAAVNDGEALAFVRTGYEWLKVNSSSSSLVGFFPEVFVPGYDRSETCINADMVAIALKLTDAGAGDYWDDADRWARNHFFESQLIDPAWVHRLGERSPAHKVAPNETSDHVAERSVGAFAGYSTGNDWVAPTQDHPDSIQHCCTGQACRTMYYLWQHILDFRSGSLYVNLLLNRASTWCDVHSYVPYEGKVDLKIKKTCDRTLIRMQEWVPGGSEQVSCEVNGRPRSIQWQGRYVDLGKAKPGDTITVKFPSSERTIQETIGGVSYKLEIRGNTVISIDPPGRNGPLYERTYYRQPVGWRKVDRFVPEREIAW
jgi:hypothetical protein